MTTRPIDTVLAQLRDPKPTKDGFRAHCPAHDDEHPSLDVTETADGTVLVKCRSSGCAFDAIATALGLEQRDFFPSENGRLGQTDADAALRQRGLRPETIRHFQIVANAEKQAWEFPIARNGAKKFKAFRPVPGGPKFWVTKGTKRGVYHLAACRDAADAWLVEGEPDVWTMHQAGLKALTFSYGAETVPAGAVKRIAEASIGVVHICYDNDEPGRQGAAKVTAAFAKAGIAHTVRQLPESVGDKGDVTTFYNNLGGDDDAFRRAMQALPEVVDAPPPPAQTPTNSVEQPASVLASAHCTDVGNAERFVGQHGTEVRYCHTWKRWLEWDGTRWAVDETGEIYRRARATVAAIFRAAIALEDDDDRQRLVKFALRSEVEARLKAMVSLAQSDQHLAITARGLDPDPWALNVANGTLDLRTGELLPHDPHAMHTKLAPVAYGETAECSRFLAFMEEVLPDPEVRTYVQRAVGYSLTGDTRERCLFIPYGTGANGKSTFLETMRALFGDYGRQADMSTFMLKRSDAGPRPEVVRLAGARFVSSIEVEEGRRLGEALVKALTGNDTIAARGLYAEIMEFRPAFKIWMATNHKPVVRGTDNAIWDRIRLIPFTVTIPPEQRDGDLGEKLGGELPGILSWALDGCLSWQQHGLAAPKAVRDATTSYRDEMDVVRRFIADRCVEAKSTSVGASDLYAAYKKWAEDGGERPMTQKRFGDRMTELDYQREEDSATRRKMYVGLSLKVTT